MNGADAYGESVPGRAAAARIAETAGRFAVRALDFAFPRFCPACHRRSDRFARHLCSDCLAGVALHEGAVCARCGAMPEGAVPRDFVCSACREKPPAFDMARSAAHFRGAVREMILSLKYGGATWLRDDLADLLEGCVRARFDFEAIDAVAPVPLHPSRLRKRAYNQSALLGEALAARIGADFRPNMLERVRATSTQTRLGAARRRANVRDAFAAAEPEWAAGRTVLLVDDVMTTGATLHECARILKSAGATRVWCATIARD